MGEGANRHMVARATTANELGAHWQVDGTVHAFSEPKQTTFVTTLPLAPRGRNQHSGPELHIECYSHQTFFAFLNSTSPT